ncbi:MAG TPA: HisA/HisF-related TIM barrel protein, partial [Pirellulaceae bacterium]|nr:HisA/HisF-related TIM barrel protein [Pirellulaceae bacterium]
VREELSIPLTVGGGVRTLVDAERLLQHGADKVSVNSAAVRRPELISEMSERFGAQCTVVAIDAKRVDDGWRVMTRGGAQMEPRDVLDWVEQVEWLGAGEILLTSHDRDGTGLGYDLDLLRAVSARCRLPLIASGGAQTADDLAEALQAGAHAVLAATIFHDEQMTVADVKARLAERGIQVRL